MEWSKKQKQAIYIRDSRVLVSAAAGSGKTAVLVKRIIERILDESNPIGVDEILVMTFTRAAARQMKEKITKSIEEALANLDKDSSNYNRLKKQAALVDCAYISTIDSFCKSVIVENIDKIDLDPNFKIADEDTLSLMREDILSKIMEEEYETLEDDFLNLVNSFGNLRSDAKILDYLKGLYSFAQAMPDPIKWLNSQSEENVESWKDYIFHMIKNTAKEIFANIEIAIDCGNREDGPQGYLNTLNNEREDIIALCNSNSFSEIRDNLGNFEFQNIGRASKKVNPKLKEIAKGIRDEYKEIITELKKKFFVDDNEILKEEENSKLKFKALIRLTTKFSDYYSQEKKENNLADFNDLEHIALNLLLTNKEVAEEYRRQFKEIYIDEYQDSNYVQEELIRAIEDNNVFMVGDVKQSIYGFRQAKPELFNEKYNTFLDYDLTQGNAVDTKIDLSTNYRSRESVLESINVLFYKIMRQELGGIEYDENVALNAGMPYPDNEIVIDEKVYKTAKKTQCIIIDKSELEEENDDSNIELEARLVAKKIKELRESLLVTDKEENTLRKLKYSDIVILLRSQAGKAEVIAEILMQEGIPAYSQTQSGYFDTFEIRKILSFLSAIDNPYKDIDLAAFLHSPICNVEDIELAQIISFYKQNMLEEKTIRLYEAVLYYLENAAADDTLYIKLEKAFDLLESYSYYSKVLKLSDLIRKIYDETGYLDYISSMPAGDIRKANLLMLLEKANQYMKSGYSGLFNFVRYIEELRKYNTDYGEATSVGEFDDTVRIMTIHKSKGLEFPVCFLCDTGKQFNMLDVRTGVIFDDKLGMGCDYVDTNLRIKGTTVKKEVIAYKKKNDLIAEELRILYVAMTRAMEQLIITGVVKDLEKNQEEYKYLGGSREIGYTNIRNANSYLDWILMCENVIKEKIDFIKADLSEFNKNEVAKEDSVVEDNISNIIEKIKDIDTADFKDESIEKMLNFDYPFKNEINLKAKMSISELNRPELEDNESEKNYFSQEILDENTQKETLTKEKNDEIKTLMEIGKQRGNAYHKLMEIMDFENVRNITSLRTFLKEMIAQGKFSNDEFKLINQRKIENFIKSDLWQTFKLASINKKLNRETQFIMGIPANELGTDSSELVLVQGIIDAYMEDETEDLILVDYKTDKVENEEVLKDRYEKQLYYYAKAIENITRKKVSKKYIWSFSLGREVEIR